MFIRKGFVTGGKRHQLLQLISLPDNMKLFVVAAAQASFTTHETAVEWRRVVLQA